MRDEAEREIRLEMEVASFIGWQNYLFQPNFGAKKRKPMTLQKYQRAIGLAKEGKAAEQMSAEESDRRAEQADALVREAFKTPLKA